MRDDVIADDIEIEPASIGAAEAVDAEVTLRLDGSTHVFPCAATDSLLDAARDAGVEPPFSCEEGHCGTCMAKLIEGSVTMTEEARALSRRDKERGFILACQAYPTAPAITIDYDY